MRTKKWYSSIVPDYREHGYNRKRFNAWICMMIISSILLTVGIWLIALDQKAHVGWACFALIVILFEVWRNLIGMHLYISHIADLPRSKK